MGRGELMATEDGRNLWVLTLLRSILTPVEPVCLGNTV